MDHPRQPHDRNVQLLKNDELGSGSYGAVCKAMWGQRLCAAKLLHPIFFHSNDPSFVTTRRRFEQECEFLNDMKHPHIVEYLGTSHDPDSGLLVLLMELMDESLTQFLERSQQPLAYHIEVDLCHDIAQALTYTHSKEIIHRDLSGNNVLLLAGRAKITDFGMSKLLDANRRMTPLTMCPGNSVYMPPEALREPPVYSKKIDCFSFGVLQIQIMTRQFPNPGPAMRVVEDSRSPTGTTNMPVLDSERRKSHIDLIDPTHTLLPTALGCLSYLEKDRPSAQDLCRQLAAIKEAPRYTQLQTLQRELQTKDQQLQDSQRRTHTLQQELQTKDQQLQDDQRRTHTLQQELQTKDQQLQDSQRRTHTLQQELQTKDQQLQDNQRRTHTLQQELQTKDQQLQDSQRRTHTLQQELQTKDQQLQDDQRRTHTLQQELQTKDQQLQDSQRRTHTLQQELQDSQRQFQRNLLQREQANKDTIGQLRRELQQAVEEKQAGERRLRELNHQLLKMPQVGARSHETLTPPRPELQQPQVKQHATGDEQLQPMRRPGPLPQKTVLQHATGDEQLQPMRRPGPPPQTTVLQHATRDEQLQPMKRPGPLPQKTVLQHATGDEQLQPMKRPGPPPQKTVMQQKAIGDMRWKIESKAPEKMCRGSAAADSNVAYFNGFSSTTVHSYNSDTRFRKWRRLPDAPHTHFTLVVVHHILTMVGGQIPGGATDSLLSLMGEGRNIKWLPNLPAMPTKRYFTAAVCSGRSLIVAGGEDGRDRLSTVEVLDTDTRQWSIASALTHPFFLATISICGERLYMLGGFDQTSNCTRSVLSCSVPELLQSCQPQPLAGKLRTVPANQSTIWQRVADAPHSLSSCATLCGQLVAVGGYKAGRITSAITGYNETTDSWEAMGDMPTARCRALVAILNGKMMVVGVWTTDVVEIIMLN